MNALRLLNLWRLAGVKICTKGMLGEVRGILVRGNFDTFSKRPLLEAMRFRAQGSLERISSQKSSILAPSGAIRALAAVSKLSVLDLSVLRCLRKWYPGSPTCYSKHLFTDSHWMRTFYATHNTRVLLSQGP